MVKQDQFLTTGAFASRAGIPTASVLKLIREGKIKAEKKSGKWMIAPDQLQARALKDSVQPGKKAAKPARPKSTASKPAPAPKGKSAKAKPGAGKTYSVAEFAALTYLTEFGVIQWLKQGRVSGRQVSGGQWQIDAANLEVPDVKRLVRQ
jgi:hypothetical protein